MKSLAHSDTGGTRNRSGRRGALLGGLGLAVAAALPATAAPHPDAELLHLGARFEALWAAERPLWRIADAHFYGEVVDEATAEAAGEQANAAGQRTSKVVRAIETTPAQTLPGLLVKTRALLWCQTGTPDEAPGEALAGLFEAHPHTELSTDSRLALAILRDLVAMTEAV